MDKFSWIVNDYRVLLNEFQGITKSTGVQFQLYRFPNSKYICGLVRYVIKGSPADTANIKRGYIFTKINDELLDTTNYRTLLSKETIKFSFAKIIDFNTMNYAMTGISKTVTTAEVKEDPIYLDTIFTINNTKIGYLVYNQFIESYDNELNKVFGKFKAKGIYLTISISSFCTVLPFINDARKAYNQFSPDFIWALIFVLFLLIIGFLCLGIFIGFSIAERKANV